MNRLSMRKSPATPAEQALSSRTHSHRFRNTCEIHHLTRGLHALGHPLLASRVAQCAHRHKDHLRPMLMKLLLSMAPRYKLLLSLLLPLSPPLPLLLLLPLSHNSRSLDLLERGSRPSRGTFRMKT